MDAPGDRIEILMYRSLVTKANDSKIRTNCEANNNKLPAGAAQRPWALPQQPREAQVTL